MEDSEFLEELRKVLDYNPETGEFTWKVSIGRKGAGSSAGFVKKDGRLYITFKGKACFAHRLAWLLTCGKWPEQVIDHIDGDPLNNRIDNLRDVSRSINMQNQRKPQGIKSEPLGVCWNKARGKFQATIKISDKNKHLGLFLTAKEAHAVYLIAKRKLHEGCTI